MPFSIWDILLLTGVLGIYSGIMFYSGKNKFWYLGALFLFLFTNFGSIGFLVYLGLIWTIAIAVGIFILGLFGYRLGVKKSIK